ncbi:MAG TPA: tetratricopeptide repeat protein [Ferruginibacter sp.]|nr:tetratricopeptide repeat protein [Ferruginibacter sp.]HRO17109.1 tetratricopeptide repeat protein [Ferruginibacter sp.]HRQ20053.1 tetratricopeptide repeat protein [Ferruginibacter sp.]
MKNTTLILLIGCAIPLKGLSNNSDSASFYFQKGIAEKEAKRFLPASSAFDKAVTFDPNMVSAYLENAQVSMEMRRIHQAMELFKKVHQLDPQNTMAISALMELNYNYRNYREAIRFAELCKGCEKSDKIIGMSLYQLEEYPAAEKKLQEASRKYEQDAEIFYTLGKNYLDMEEYAKAIPYYEKAVIIDPTKGRWMYELGLICYNQSKYQEAVAAFDKAAVAGYTQSNDFKENLGFAAIYAGYDERGEALLLELQSKKPGNTEITRSLAEIYYQQRKYDKSLKMCQLLMEKNPDDSKALYQAGLNFIKKGEKDRGQQMCDKAIEEDPSLASLRKKKEMLGGL